MIRWIGSDACLTWRSRIAGSMSLAGPVSFSSVASRPRFRGESIAPGEGVAVPRGRALRRLPPRRNSPPPDPRLIVAADFSVSGGDRWDAVLDPDGRGRDLRRLVRAVWST
jgi:hypothetical protein